MDGVAREMHDTDAVGFEIGCRVGRAACHRAAGNSSLLTSHLVRQAHAVSQRLQG